MISGGDLIKNKIGLFGGTFDPLHYGHLISAQFVLENMDLDKVVFIPAGNPPHKRRDEISPGKIRYEMVKLGIAGNNKFAVSKIESNSEFASYTVDSLGKMKISYPASDLHLLIGSDQALTLSTWKDPEKIFGLCKVVVMVRPGYDPADIEGKWRKRILLIRIPLIEISASGIRARVSNGGNIDYLVPEKVGSYIKQHRLYQAKSGNEQH